VPIIKIGDPASEPESKHKKNKRSFEKIDPKEMDQKKLKEKLENGKINYLHTDKKKIIIVTARVHPGETVSSYIVEGLIRFLVFANKKSNIVETSKFDHNGKPYSPNAIRTAKFLRKKFVFMIIPMVNPDGVVAGHYKSSFAGHDLNKIFLIPNKKLHPVIYHIQNLVASSKDKIFSYIDLQGHVKKKCTFIYGPEFPLHNQNYFKIRALPKILDTLSEDFRFHSCMFHVNKHNERTARVVLYRKFDITY